jgi:hypothetical protein
MGVIHKLKPEIRNFIIKQKEINPLLSCRKLSAMINEKFQIKVSKSHVNAVIKKKGLSSGVGRKPKPKKGIIEASDLGIYMLRSADRLIGGIKYIAELVNKYLPEKGDILSLVEALVYLPLFEEDIKPESGLWKLAGKQFKNKETLLSYLEQLQPVTILNDTILQTLNHLLEEVLFLKIVFSDNSSFSLDGQLRTLWSSPTIPYDFSITPYYIKSYINNFAKKENQALVLFTAPGYDLFPANWLDFLVKCNLADERIIEIGLMGTNAKEKEKLTFSTPKRCNIIFGLWPWQYANYRQLESATLSKPFYFSAKKQNFYVADAIVKLSQHFISQSVTLRAIILRKSQDATPELVILTTIPKEKASAEDIATLYLNRWPNLQDGFKDYSRKIELFTYNVSSHQTFPKEKIFSQASKEGVKGTLRAYLDALDTYVRWYFLPLEYKQLDLSTTKSRFYSLRAQIRKKPALYIVSFIPPKDYSYSKDLAYAIDRMNEREIVFEDGRRVWFTIK